MDIQIIQETCITCNVVFWITKEHQQRLGKCKNTFYCPNGHPLAYGGETDAHKIASLRSELRDELQCSERLARSNSALRGVITRKKNKQTNKKTLIMWPETIFLIYP